jgi:protein TonB
MKQTLLIFLFFLNFYSYAQNTPMEESESLEKDSIISEEFAITLVEDVPEYPGCELVKKSEKKLCLEEHINSFILSKFIYPSKAAKKNIEGKVIISFVINKEGNVVNIKPTGNADQILKDAAVRIFEQLPKFKPASLADGKIVSVKYAMPITFKLQ